MIMKTTTIANVKSEYLSKILWRPESSFKIKALVGCVVAGRADTGFHPQFSWSKESPKKRTVRYFKEIFNVKKNKTLSTTIRH